MTLALTWELARKDLRLFLGDRRSALLCFAVPILLASLFGTVFQHPAGGSLKRIALQLVVEDGSPITGRVVAGLLASDRLRVLQSERSSALKELARDDVGVVLILPAGFGTSIDLLRRPGTPASRVEVLHQPARVLEAGLVQGVFTEIAMREAVGVVRDRLLPADGNNGWQLPFVVDRAPLHGSISQWVDSYGHSFCGMSLQYLLFWGVDSGLLLLRERRQGIWRRLRSAPVGLHVLLGGKALATALVALLQILVAFTFARLVFGVTINGSLVGFSCMALAAALLSAATGLLVAGLGGTEARARSIAILTILILSLLGGLWVPSFVLPGWVQHWALLLPSTWAVRGLDGTVWQGMRLGPALQCAGNLLAFCGVFLVIAWYCMAVQEVRLTRKGGQL